VGDKAVIEYFLLTQGISDLLCSQTGLTEEQFQAVLAIGARPDSFKRSTEPASYSFKTRRFRYRRSRRGSTRAATTAR
jgi:hypothetical protein